VSDKPFSMKKQTYEAHITTLVYNVTPPNIKLHFFHISNVGIF